MVHCIQENPRGFRVVLSRVQTGHQNKPHPSINVHLYYPNDFDGSVNESSADKIRQYHVDYHNRPSNVISFMTPIPSTSGSSFAKADTVGEPVS